MFEFKDRYNIDDLLEIMALLRSENGCPWDKVQTHESIRTDLIEETYEVCEGIDNNSPEMLREELGDLLLQIAFHSQIEREFGNFTFEDVCNDICQKLVYRHPHVFGEVKVNGSDEVLKNWDALKKESKNQETYTETLESVPKTFPALLRGEKLCKRASRAGMPIDRKSEMISYLHTLLDEIDLSANEDSDTHNQQKIGELLLGICNLNRNLKVDGEKALTYASNRFIIVFAALEKQLNAQGRSFSELTDEELRLLIKQF
ncbi:MAG: nucleoside triphosphate pyrophosphohydrolase [Oscillospiraceae bacterium]